MQKDQWPKETEMLEWHIGMTFRHDYFITGTFRISRNNSATDFKSTL